MATLTHRDQRLELVRAAELLTSSGVMSHTGHVNLSCRIDDHHLLLTSRGTVAEVRADALAVVALDGEVREGEVAPSTREIVPMHTGVYQARPEAGGVVHTHSPHATAFALAARPLPCRYEALLRHGQGDEVPVAPWAPRGSQASVQGIVDALHAHPESSAVLLANHGLLAFARSPLAAAKLVIILEEAAAAELKAASLGGAKDFPPGAFEEVRGSMARAGS
jgi:L-ribulose-5-phosphate 4-epimerase